MRVLLLGGGGREHALAWAIAKSPLVTKLVCAPGNAGIAAIAETRPVDVKDNAAVVALAKEAAADFVVVGPDDPLANGVVDALEAAGFLAFGPTKAAARLEWSKGFTKDLCREQGIPTARYERFADEAAARAYAAAHPLPVVIKADGLALGKGVVIAETRAQADAAVREMFEGKFGPASREIVIEEFLTGEEASFFALCDGERAVALPTAQDHKRVGDGDRGPNTGGMGAYSPAPAMTPERVEATLERIVRPTLAAMRAKGTPFKGVLYAGLMLTDEGPKLIEYNARFGDPETQVLMPRIESDIVPLLFACAKGDLSGVELRVSPHAALTVAMATRGYPGPVDKGSTIRGVEAAARLPGVTIFHAGTSRAKDGRLISNGGRVLNVTAVGRDVAEAQARAYASVDAIDWPEGFCRRDIGWRAVGR